MNVNKEQLEAVMTKNVRVDCINNIIIVPLKNWIKLREMLGLTSPLRTKPRGEIK